MSTTLFRSRHVVLLLALLLLTTTALAQDFRVFAAKGRVDFFTSLLDADNNSLTGSFVVDVPTIVFIRTEEPSVGAADRLQDTIVYLQRLGGAPFWVNDDWQEDTQLTSGTGFPLVTDPGCTTLNGFACATQSGNQFTFFNTQDDIRFIGGEDDIVNNPNNSDSNRISAGVLCLSAGQYVVFVAPFSVNSFTRFDFGQSVITVESLGPC